MPIRTHKVLFIDNEKINDWETVGFGALHNRAEVTYKDGSTVVYDTKISAVEIKEVRQSQL